MNIPEPRNAAAGSGQYRFGAFTLDLDRGMLRRGEEPVNLRPKTFLVLAYLAERHGRIISSAELMNAIWPDVSVTENSLSQCLVEIRRALDDANQTMLKTVARRGYLFDSEVQKPGLEPLPLRPVAIAEPQVKPKQGPGFHLRPGRRVAAVLLLAVASWYTYSFWSRSSPARADEPTLAILPFQSIGPTEASPALRLGLADALITRLTNIRHLVVRPTSTVRQFTMPNRDPLAIGRQLKVAYVLDGSIQQVGESIRVSIQLVSVAQARTLWAENYDERLHDLLAIQDAVSARVTAVVAPRLAGAESARVHQSLTADVEAFRAYVRGRYLFETRTPENLETAIHSFLEATRRDPQFASAYAAAAHCYGPLLMRNYWPPSPERKAEQAALVHRALAIDPNLAEAQLGLAIVKAHDWEWLEAEKAFRRAIDLKPNLPLARAWFGFFLHGLSRHQEGLAERRRLWDLDSFSSNANMALGDSLLWAGRYDDALPYLRMALEISPDYVQAIEAMGRFFLLKKMYPEAIREFRKHPETQPHLAYTLALHGERGAAEQILARISKDAAVGPYRLAFVHSALGRKERALDLLEEGYRRGIPWTSFLKVDEKFASLRGHPRFESLTRRMNVQ